MEDFALALFAVAVIGIPIAVLLKNGYGTKRGCGGGCATCRNRPLCHPDRTGSGEKEEEKRDD